MLSTHLASSWIDVLLATGAFVAAFAFPSLGSNWFHNVEQWCSKLARRRRLAVLVVGLLALAVRAAVLPIRPIPQPRMHDEFSYLLAADTFAHGRLTNPPHPMWIHFESFHILQKPTYMSKFYPAQGLVLAAGQAVAGHPFWGVWLSVGLMCASLCWMLQGWMPPEWAFLGGLLSALRLGTFSFGGSRELLSFSYWGNSYWGGAVAATGGALLVGALPRLRRSPRVGRALLLSLGLAILANSRPYEGLFLGLAVAAVMAVGLVGKRGPTLGVFVRQVVAPLLIGLILTGCGMGFYFCRVTGSPFRIPYLVYARTYDFVPNFPWQSLKTVPNYHHKTMKEFSVGFEFGSYQFARKHAGKWLGEKASDLVMFFWGPLLMMPVVALLLARRGKFFSGLAKPSKARLLLLICTLPLVGMALPVYFLPHYAAPLTGALNALAMLAIRHLRLWKWRNRPVGQQMVRMVPVLAIALLVLHTSVLAARHGLFAPSQDFGRSGILAQLQSYTGGQLVIVQYAPNHLIHDEWVYNDADIDAAKVVWARDMGTSENEELIRYFKDRRVWLLKADGGPAKLLPYVFGKGNEVALACAKP
jgi:hypothetical protein